MKFVEKFADSMLVCFAAGVLGVGCSSSATEEPASPVDPNEAPVEIVLNGGVSVSASADVVRSAAPDTRLVVNAVHAALPISILRCDESASGTYPAYNSSDVKELKATLKEFTDASATDKKSNIEFNDDQFYLISGLKTKLCAWYPQVGTTDDNSTFASGVVTCKINGKNDIMRTTAELEGSKTSPITGTFSFEHLLTQIQVSAYAVDAKANEVWGGIKEVAIKDEGGKVCKITLSDTYTSTSETCALPDGASASNLPLIKKSLDDKTVIAGADGSSEYGASNVLALPVKSATVDPTSLGYAMFAPVDASGDPAEATITLVITTEKETSYEQKVSITSGFEATKAYKITLKFTASGIVPSGSITDWKDGATIPEIEL